MNPKDTDPVEMLVGRQIEKRFGEHAALRPTSIEFRAGELTAILGANGAGKSTLLNILGGIVQPTSGVVEVQGGHRIRSVISAMQSGVSFAHQEPALIPDWKVEDHFPAELRASKPWSQLLPGLDGAALAGELPSHDQQQLEIARALATARTCILADEPTAGLGAAEKNLVLDALQTAAASGLAVIWVTHDLKAALSRAKRIVVLRAGSVVKNGLANEMSLEELLAAMGVVNRPSSPTDTRDTECNADPDYLVFRTGSHEIIVRSSEIVGLVGNTDSSARNLFRSALGFCEQKDFSVAINGKGLGRTVQELGASGVKYMSRERTTEWLLDRQSLAFNLAAASFSRVSGFLGLFEREVRALAEDFAAKYDVTAPSVDIEIEALSGGNRQKAVLARLASSGPRFLLLDEPFSGVDQPTRFRLFSLLRKLASDGMGIIIYSQESRDLVSATDRIAVMLGKRRPLDLLSRETAPEFVEHLIVTGDLARRETV